MKAILLSLLLATLGWAAAAQAPSESVWSFGEQAVVDFSTLSPVVSTLPNNGGAPLYAYYRWSATISDNNGQVLFWAKMLNSNSPSFNVYDRNGQAMPNGTLFYAATGNFIPVVIPAPGSTTKYYLFYIRNHGLLYSVVDMSLNGGLGDVVPTQKNILLGSFGNVLDRKLVAMQGCNGAWIIVRAAFQNQYMSYAVTSRGIDTTASISPVGNLPLAYYGASNQASGVLKASPDGTRMVAACGIGSTVNPSTIHGGLELYDVEPCSGKLLNPVVVDTGMFYGACFSPDGSKLYATKSFEHKVYQYDLSLGSPAAIRASRTLVLTNPAYGNVDGYDLGELKRARDGKIYLSNNVCDPSWPSTLHVIGSPNSAGLACNPALNAVYLGNACPGLDLPADIVYGPRQDTLYGPVKDTMICFRDSGMINAPAGFQCYRWAGDTITGRSRMVKSPGTYVALYSDGACKLRIDTIRVSFTRLKAVTGGSYSCPGKDGGTAWAVPQGGDTTRFTYTWTNSAGRIVRSQMNSAGDTLKGADTGTYTVRLTTATGCDTLLTATVKSYPMPVAAFKVDTVVCKDMPLTFTYTGTAPVWKWHFDLHDSSTDSTVTRVYRIATRYPMMLVVRNVEGCTDTLRKTIEVRELALNLSASKEAVNIGEEVTLHTNAPQSYSVLRWKPEAAFGASTAYNQQVKVNATTTYVVTGESQDGCIDSAAVTVNVNPVVFMPDAFTPNGDGRNDRFRPRATGDNIFIRHFEVYNRWGQLVWKGYGPSAAEGWDGTFGGKPAEMGTYFYTIDIETPSGGTIAQKGDVILVR